MAEKKLTEAGAIEVLEKTNDRLRGTGVRLEMRGKSRLISLRGTFPPKPGTGQIKPQQSRHSLKLRGNTRPDIKQAEAIARQVGVDLNSGTFDWRKWSDWEDEAAAGAKTTGDWIEALERWYYDTRARDDSTQNTWRVVYGSTLKHLPVDAPLTPELIIEWITTHSQPGIPRRTHYCRAGRSLCRVAGIEINLTDFDFYSGKAINPREILPDAELLALREGLLDPGWRFLLGLQLAYGLRNHEMLLIDYSSFPRLRVTRGKTGPRTVTPIMRQWAEEWELGTPIYPKGMQFSPDMPLEKLGMRITRGYKGLGLPRPYNVRHAFARRCLSVGLEPSLGAKLMGHTVNEHTETYRAWIDEEVYLDAVDRALEKLEV